MTENQAPEGGVPLAEQLGGEAEWLRNLTQTDMVWLRNRLAITADLIDQARAALAAPAPQAAPVALTDAQILNARRSITNEPPARLPLGWVNFARAIERAHGIPAPQTKEPTNDR